MEFEDALRLAGQWGRYQLRMYLLAALPHIFSGFQMMMVVFTVFVPKHRCAVPGLVNDTFDFTSEDHKQRVLASIPYTIDEDDQLIFDQCHLYSQGHNNSILTNTSLVSNESMATETCNRWVYDTSEVDNSLITKFNLVCDNKHIRSHSNTMMMAGFLAVSALSSALCDWIGRKIVLYCCIWILVVFGIWSSFPLSPGMLLALRFFGGFGQMGIPIVAFVLVVELMGGAMRTRLGAAWSIMWTIGPFLLAAISFFVRDWQTLQLIGTLPSVVFLVYWWVLPESPRWQTSKGRIPEAMVTLKKIAKVNSKNLPPTLEEQLRETSGFKIGRRTLSVSPLVMLKHPTLLLRCLIISFNWGIISMTYFGLSLNVQNLSGGVRINFVVSCIVEAIGYGLAVLLLDKLGRKRLLSSAMFLAGTSCLLTIITVLYAGKDNQWVTTMLAMLGKMGICTCFGTVYMFTAELYPTVLRNFGVGFGSASARACGLLSPYIADLALHITGPLRTAVPLMIFGGLAMVAGLMSLLLPETLHKKLPETVLDAVHFGRIDRKDEHVDEQAEKPCLGTEL